MKKEYTDDEMSVLFWLWLYCVFLRLHIKTVNLYKNMYKCLDFVEISKEKSSHNHDSIVLQYAYFDNNSFLNYLFSL